MYLYCLVQIYGSHFLHAIFDHLGGEEILFSLPFYCDLPIVLLMDIKWEVTKRSCNVGLPTSKMGQMALVGCVIRIGPSYPHISVK